MKDDAEYYLHVYGDFSKWLQTLLSVLIDSLLHNEPGMAGDATQQVDKFKA
jgi:hypothetical protein